MKLPLKRLEGVNADWSALAKLKELNGPAAITHSTGKACGLGIRRIVFTGAYHLRRCRRVGRRSVEGGMLNLRKEESPDASPSLKARLVYWCPNGILVLQKAGGSV